MSISMMKLSLRVNDIKPHHVAALLNALLELPEADLDLTVVCESWQSSGQWPWRVRNKMTKTAAKSFEFLTPTDYPVVDICFSDSRQPHLEEVDPEEQQDSMSVSSASSKGSTADGVHPIPSNGQLPSGDYKLVARGYEKFERGSQYFIEIEWEIIEGLHRGKQFTDKVMVWPVDHQRSQHFARAVNIKPEDLATQLDALVGVRVWDRRIIRDDGTAVNHYYPADGTLPPKWN